MYQRDGKSAIKKDLKNTQAICEILGNPEKNFRSIHIAGTNGKGSTAHMLASVFQEAGYKTGLYTSPHLKDFRERVKINGKMINEDEVIHFVEDHQEIFQEIRPSFFEWTVALAFDHFSKHQVDIAIIETGLGGRLDSTNVIRPIMSVITNIGMDHMDMLGDTPDKIAFEKAGIIKEGIPIVIGNRSGVEEVFKAQAEARHSKIIFAEDRNSPLIKINDLRGKYQKENIKTVITTWNELRLDRLNDIKISYPQFLKGITKTIKNTNLRGRWEIISENPKIIADVAHNEAGVKYIVSQLKEEKYQRLHFVLGVVKEKDLKKILTLLPKEARYYYCAAKIPRALPTDELKKAADEIGLSGLDFGSVEEAVQAAKQAANKGDLIYIGGSTFTVAEAL